MRSKICGVLAGIALAGAAVSLGLRANEQTVKVNDGNDVQRDRSPVDLVFTQNERWLFTANQTSNTVSVVNLQTGKVEQELPCGTRPEAVALSPREDELLATSSLSGTLTIYSWMNRKLKKTGSVHLGFEPRGMAISPDGRLAYAALATGKAIAVVDLKKRQVLNRIKVGAWPRYLALTSDGKRLVAGVNGEGYIAVIDTDTKKVIQRAQVNGINFGRVQISADNKSAYVPWMSSQYNPPRRQLIRAGWMLASRISRIPLDGEQSWETLSLDPRGKAVSDPHGLALSPDQSTMVCTASGTHELLVYRMADLPMHPFGNHDHLPIELAGNKERFDRIELGGRPLAVRYSRVDKHVYVANYLRNSVQIVNVPERKVTKEVFLGGRRKPTLARRGEAIFYDAGRSLEQWYSCHSCHYEGHTNAIPFDTSNDGRFGNPKMVLSLRNVTRTGPWTWHGWQKDLAASIHKSMTETMQGKAPTKEETHVLIAFLDTLKTPPSPYRRRDGSLTDAARRGEKVFHSAKAGCARCHSGKYFTDGRVHDVLSGKSNDAFDGYNPPSLLGIHDRVGYLHDGRAASLQELLRGPHDPARVIGRGNLTKQELSDLINYLRSL